MTDRPTPPASPPRRRAQGQVEALARGDRLYIGAGTVKTHVARLLAKLGARDRVQLVIHAYRSGLAG
ncbi:response regulator transcription factor [Streptomyces sp. CLV115]|uniref:response regulator transcription factor n=1 Tax=Streptomyces sp. CLV115 TaxID=3138502 RepID=UPI00406C39D3